MRTSHPERHRTERIGWLRAAVLGANDGIVSTASLVVGVAAAKATNAAKGERASVNLMDELLMKQFECRFGSLHERRRRRAADARRSPGA